MAGERIMVAMSGGVDSSVAALLLQRQGYEVIGMTAELFGDASAAGPCCGREGACAAKGVCDHLGIPHIQADLTELFEAQVINRFLDEYQAGRTPNPCSDCNRFIKFDTFFKLAKEHGCGLLATGHHARIIRSGTVPGTDQSGGTEAAATRSEAQLATATDPNKDQTYFLACIPPERLSRIRFPVGEYPKEQVRQLALATGLPTATRDESQDICFITNSIGIRELMSWHRGVEPQPGKIVTDQGQVLGEHPGIEHFTIGQRKGLKLGGGTEGLVVHRLETATNTVVVAQRDAHQLAAIRLCDFTDMAPGLWQPGEEVMVRSRYRQPLWRAKLDCTTDGAPLITPLDVQYNTAPGQWLVGYREDVVLFGGIIGSVSFTDPA